MAQDANLAEQLRAVTDAIDEAVKGITLRIRDPFPLMRSQIDSVSALRRDLLEIQNRCIREAKELS